MEGGAVLFLSRCHSCYQTGQQGGGGEAKQKDFIYPKPIYCEVFSQKLSFLKTQTQAAGLPLGNVAQMFEGILQRLFVKAELLFAFCGAKSSFEQNLTYSDCYHSEIDQKNEH